MIKKGWDLARLPDLSGKVALVTGGNIGLGFTTSLELARKGADVHIACRSTTKGELAAERILKEVPNAKLQVLELDLVNLDSVQQCANTFLSKNRQLDMLVNNAGVVNLEHREMLPNGQEMHMATNHFGHFALTGHLFPMLKSTAHARVVSVSSLAYSQGVIDFSDLAWEKRTYSRLKAYGDSKLANLLFINPLNRLFRKSGVSAIAVAAHPGLTATERQQSIGVGGVLTKWLASPVSKGCLSQLRAAAGTDVTAGQFYGPRFGAFGSPVLKQMEAKALDEQVADKLWDISEKLTGVRYQ